MKNLFLLLVGLLAACTTTNEETVGMILDIQGHRGARGLYPENSLPGFEYAHELGVNTLELDVCVSMDKKLFISHEPFFSHAICLTPEGEKIDEDSAQMLNMYQMTYDQISAYDCGSLGNPGFPDQKKVSTKKPLLTELFDLIEPKNEGKEKAVNYNIEIKSHHLYDNIYHPAPAEFSELVYNTINGRVDWSRITIQSFDFRVLQYFNKNYPEVRLALLIENELSWQENIDSLGFIPNIYSSYYKLLNEDNILAIRYMDMQVIPWTVNNKDEMKKLIDLGVDGIITDYPNLALELINNK